jgi:GntR family transcriptional regulator, arabinose operon transcriptional repressor
MSDAVPKYRALYARLRRDIQSGRLTPGQRLPTEAELVRASGASRITVSRAMRDLQAAGLIERRAGAGSFVRADTAAASSLSFGLLIPNLGDTEIFEGICQGMMGSPLARDHALLWGSHGAPRLSPDEHAWQLCRQYIERRVAGVFFAPLEHATAGSDINLRISRALDDARIPVVLLDRTVLPWPGRGHHDLVGIDNRRAGYVMTDHLAAAGGRRIGFVAAPDSAATVDAREAGYREALYAHTFPIERHAAARLDPGDRQAVATWLAATGVDAVVAANDNTAARLLHTLLALGRRVPEDLRLAGIDDLPASAVLPVPLTTLRQPTQALGDAALSAMLQRVARTDLAARDILLHGELVVRRSCGAARD